MQDRTHPSLAALLRTRREDILAGLTSRLRSVSPARDLSPAEIADRLSPLLERMAAIVESPEAEVSLGGVGREHAVDRLAQGFDFEHLVREFGYLRESILEQWDRHVAATIDVRQMRLLDRAFDEALRDAAMEYALLRGRVLRAVNRLSEAAFGPGELDAFLGELIRIAIESMQDVDTAAILLREGEHLRMHAASGLEEELTEPFSLRIGEGFSGRIALLREPMSVRNAAEDPMVKGDLMRRKGVRGLYGVPLTRGNELLGVAHIGSLTASEFSQDDKLLFRAMANRAASVIAKARLMAELRRAAMVQQFLADASKQLSETLDYKTTVEKVSHLAVPAFADWCVVDLLEDDGLHRVSVAHSDPGREKRVRELDRQYPVDLNSPVGIPKVLRTGQSDYVRDLPPGAIAAAARDPGHLKLLEELQLRSYIIAPLVVHGRVIGALTMVMAESDRRYDQGDVHVAEELARRVATAIENSRLYSEAQVAIQTRERVLAIVSHDLRNQLGVIRMTARLIEALSSRGDPAAMKKALDTIDRTAGAMRRLVDDLLDMASIQAGRISMIARPVDLKQLLEQACDPMVPVADAKGIRLECPGVEDVKVMADPERILQVLGNLIGNALKFCRHGDTITVGAEVRQREVQIRVRDTGPGIAPDELPTVFDAYRAGRRNENAGTGLGLFIAKGIVEQHGGRLWCESRLGGGTTFFFTLPLA